MRRFLSAASVCLALVLPLAAHADTYGVTNIVSGAPAGQGQTIGSQATNQALSNSTAITFDYNPTGTGSGPASLSFTIDIITAYGTEVISESGTNAATFYQPGFDSSLFTPGTPTITGPDEYSVVFSSINSPGSGATETIYAQIYGTPGFVAPTPEPSSLILLGTGLLGCAGSALRRLHRKA